MPPSCHFMPLFLPDIYELRASVRRYLSVQDCCKACRVCRVWYEWLNPGVWNQLTPLQPHRHNLARHGHHVRKLSVHMPFFYAEVKPTIRGPEQSLRSSSPPPPSPPPSPPQTSDRFAQNVFRYCQLMEHVDICTALDHDDLANLSTFLNDLVPVTTAMAAISTTCGGFVGADQHQRQHSYQRVWLPSSSTASVRTLTLQFSDFSAKTVISWLLKAHSIGHFAHLQEIVFQSDSFSSDIMPFIEAALIRIAHRFKSLNTIKFAKRIRHLKQGRIVCVPSLIAGEQELEEDDDDAPGSSGSADRDGNENDIKQAPPLKILLLGPVALSTATMVRLAGPLSGLTHFGSSEELDPTILDSLAKRCRTLQKLVIGSCWKTQHAQDLFSSSVAKLFRGSPELCLVNITRTLDGSVGLLPSLLDHCIRVEMIMITSLTNAHPQDVGRMFYAWPKLRLLDIGVSPDMSAEHALLHLDQWSTTATCTSAWNSSPISPIFPSVSQPIPACAQTLRTLRLRGIQVLTLQEAHALRLMLNMLTCLHEFSISASVIHQGIFFDDPEFFEEEDIHDHVEQSNATTCSQQAQIRQHHRHPTTLSIPYPSTTFPPSPHRCCDRLLQVQYIQKRPPIAFHCPSLVEIGAHARFLTPANAKQVRRFLSGVPRLESMASFTLDPGAVAYLQQSHPHLIEE